MKRGADPQFYGRESELAEIRASLDSPGRLMAWWGPTGIGKSMLRVRAMERARAAGFATAHIDFNPDFGVLLPGDFIEVLGRLADSFGRPCPRFAIARLDLEAKQMWSAGETHSILEHAAAPGVECALEGIIDGIFQPGALVVGAVKSGILLHASRVRTDKVNSYRRTPEGRELVKRVNAWKPEEFRAGLIALLAEDWRQEAGGRLAIFIDTFERVQRAAHNQPQEQWSIERPFLDLFLATSDFASWTLFSQDRLTWAEETDEAAEGEELLLRSLEGLDRAAAIQAIEAEGVRPIFQDRILDFSQESGEGEETRHHGLSLRLAARTVREASAKDPSFHPDDFRLPRQDIKELVRKFLSIQADERRLRKLSVTPRFDRAALGFAFGQQLETDQISLWAEAGDWPFLSLSRSGEWRSLHPQFRQALLQDTRETANLAGFIEAAHREWEDHWRAANEPGLAFRHFLAVTGVDAARRLSQEQDECLRRGDTREHFSRLGWWAEAEEELREWPAAEQHKALLLWGNQLQQAALGDLRVQAEAAIRLYRECLDLQPRSQAPMDWAMTQNNLGNTLSILGEREEGTGRLEEAVRAYRAALEVRTRDAAPMDWATAQNNLGNALQALGGREEGTGRLEEAVRAYRAALEVYTRDAAPMAWAMTQNNLGSALQALGGREEGTGRLEEAVGAFRAALEIYTRDAAPMNWAASQNNLGSALQILGEREEGTGRLEEAVRAYRAALEVRTPEQAPFYHSRTAANLSRALALIAARKKPSQ